MGYAGHVLNALAKSIDDFTGRLVFPFFWDIHRCLASDAAETQVFTGKGAYTGVYCSAAGGNGATVTLVDGVSASDPEKKTLLVITNPGANGYYAWTGIKVTRGLCIVRTNGGAGALPDVTIVNRSLG